MTFCRKPFHFTIFSFYHFIVIVFPALDLIYFNSFYFFIFSAKIEKLASIASQKGNNSDNNNNSNNNNNNSSSNNNNNNNNNSNDNNNSTNRNNSDNGFNHHLSLLSPILTRTLTFQI